VFLPPSYARDRAVVTGLCALHGYSIGAEQWSQEIHVPQTIEERSLGAKEMIVVLPDSKTVHNGSMIRVRRRLATSKISSHAMS
jgi:hypothetical protein